MKRNIQQTKKFSVLVVDDQPNWMELLTELLNELENELVVTSVESYDKALESIRSQHPPFHVVVTDMRLVDNEPLNESGLQLLEYLFNRGDETKTIVITGYPTIETAKKALSRLNAYDYLEKRPADGSPFDTTKFRKLVQRAAREADSLRPEGFNDISRKILLLEPNLERGLEIKDILSKEGYEIDLIQKGEELNGQAGESTKEYSLVLLNKDLSGQQELETLKNKFPNVNIILLTSRDVEPIFTAMREYPILTAVSLPENQVDKIKLRELVHSALSVKAHKYISLHVFSGDGQEQTNSELKVGITYACKLLMHEKSRSGATRILLLPTEQRKGKIQLDLFLFAEQMEIKPGTETYWEIPTINERPAPWLFSLTPRTAGAKELVIEIGQNHRSLGRIKVTFEVKEL